MKKSFKIYVPLLIGIACAFGIYLGSILDFSDNSPGMFGSNSKKEKLSRLIDYIDYEYVDDVNTDSIVDVTINNILKNLDPHSVYIPKDEYALVSRNMQGDFVGIGVKFYKIRDTISVIQPIKSGPSESVGILAGDKILYANDIALFGKELGQDSIIKILKGPVGSEVDLKIYRKGDPDLLDFKVKRNVVALKSVVASYKLCDHLGYIKIDRFAETTSKEFHSALQKLVDEGITKLVLDLRNNGGGYLEEAVQVVDEFLPKGKLVLFTKNKQGNLHNTYATNEGIFEHGRLYVLINENSASASEIVAGALQDNDVGTIVGRRSFGKGLVQKEMKLGDGSAVRLTVARYYTPTGRSIQRSYQNGNKAYFEDYLHRYENGELVDADSIEVIDSLKYTTPGGKIVYGGGGIIPDVFVAKDVHYSKEKLDYMLQIGLMDRFIFNQLEKNRPFYNKLDFADFYSAEIIDDQMIQKFLVYLDHLNFGFEVRDYKKVVKEYLKATMAQQLFGSNAAQKILNQNDDMIGKTIDLAECETGIPE